MDTYERKIAGQSYYRVVMVCSEEMGERTALKMLNLREMYLSGTLISREKTPPSYGVSVPPTISVNQGTGTCGGRFIESEKSKKAGGNNFQIHQSQFLLG